MPLLNTNMKKPISVLPNKKMSKKKIEDIKDKLSGKNYSPIVAKVKSGKISKKKTLVSSVKSSNVLSQKKQNLVKQNLKSSTAKSAEEADEFKPKEKKKTRQLPITRSRTQLDNNINQATKESEEVSDPTLTTSGKKVALAKKKGKIVITKESDTDTVSKIPGDKSDKSKTGPRTTASRPVKSKKVVLAKKKVKIVNTKESDTDTVSKIPGDKSDKSKTGPTTTASRPVKSKKVALAKKKGKIVNMKESETDAVSKITGDKSVEPKTKPTTTASKPVKSKISKIKTTKLKKKVTTPVSTEDTQTLESNLSPDAQEAGNKEEDGKVKSVTIKKKKKTSDTLKPISNIKTLKKKLSLKAKALKRNKRPQRGVVIFKNIPHGFYEKEIRDYCSQFGKVTGVYHPVSKKGNSRGYAFVQFAHKEVAEVVAETMNNYVMFYKRMRCEFVPKERERPGMFRYKKTNEDLARERREAGLKQRMRPLNKEEVAAWEKRKNARVNALHKKLAALGVDYEFKVTDRTQLKELCKQPSKSDVK